MTFVLSIISNLKFFLNALSQIRYTVHVRYENNSLIVILNSAFENLYCDFNEFELLEKQCKKLLHTNKKIKLITNEIRKTSLNKILSWIKNSKTVVAPVIKQIIKFVFINFLFISLFSGNTTKNTKIVND